MLVLRDIKNYKECKKIQLDKGVIKYVKFNQLDNNQYYVCWDDNFKIYDIRTHKEIESRPEFSNSIDIFNDSCQYLLAFSDSLKLFEKELIRDWQFEDLSHINMNILNYSNPELLLIGTNSGDLYYA
jgi:hypothetical protein